MQYFGEAFIEALPRHIEQLRIPQRATSRVSCREPLSTQIKQVTETQKIMFEVLRHPITQEAQRHTENSFEALLLKEDPDVAVLKFFNGWNETHKTTSLVSAKIIMRLSADMISAPEEKRLEYNHAMAHMYEVAKDDFGLGHVGHDGMYCFMTAAFGATRWTDSSYRVRACNEFSDFLHDVGVAEHKAALESAEHTQAIMDAMMVSIASELWNGREYNFIAQHIQTKLVAMEPGLRNDPVGLRNAKGYVVGHAGEVENRHGLHALAAAHAFGDATGRPFDIYRLRTVMLDYNQRVGRAFSELHASLALEEMSQSPAQVN